MMANLFATVQWCFYDGSGRMEPTRSVCSKRCMFGFLLRVFGRKLFSFEISGFYLETKLHINALELLTVMVTIKMWGRNWKGKKCHKL